MFVVPGPPPDDAPDDVREGITRRRLVATAGRCPSGARPAQPHRGRLEVRHEAECPAATELLAAAVTRWRAGGAA